MIPEALLAAGFVRGEWFQLASIKDRRITCRAFQDASEAMSWAESAEGDIYICLNPLGERRDRKARNEDITVARCLLIDLDPEKTDSDPKGVSPEARAAARSAAIEAHAIVGGALIDSGRGQQLWIQLEADVDRHRLWAGLKARLTRPLVTIDSTYEPSRLARLPGFVNTRTGERAKIVVSEGPALTAEQASQYYVAVSVPVPGTVPADLRGSALRIWREIEITDRSKRDARFTLSCLRIGLSETRTRELLIMLPGGKAHEDQRTDESYWTSTINWARREWSEDRAALRLARRAKPSRALDEDVVAALARVHDIQKIKYYRALDRLSEEVPKSDIRKAVAQACARAAVPEWDGFARHAVSDGNSAGWWYKGAAGWVLYSSHDWARNLTGRGVPPATMAQALADRPWTLVAEPFHAEELSGRRWNRQSAKLRHIGCAGAHPMWDQLLRVVGRGLDALWPEGGANYLLLWIASVIQRPHVKLPYLFLHGEAQNAGKSSLHEAIDICLLERGYAVANEALSNDKGFNGELHGAVICAADEIRITSRAYTRIKNWVTGERILIHPKGKTTYWLSNTTHWIQTGQKEDDCPQMKGDTRITSFIVWPADEVDRVAKDVMFKQLSEESPAFTHTLLTLKLPPVVGRLGLPVLETASKAAQQKANRNELEEFLDTNYPAHLAWPDDELVSRFLASLHDSKRGEWPHSRVTLGVTQAHVVERRLVQTLQEIAPWEGTASQLHASPGIKGDWSSPDALGIALGKTWPGLKIERRRTKKARLFKVVRSRVTH